MPEAARLSDPIAHSSALAGLIAGAVLGALIGAAAIATGGAALVAVAAVAGGAAAGAGIGEVLGSLSFMPMTVTGAIASGSQNVTVNSLPAARAHLDSAPCAGMPPLMLPSHGPMILAQGSMTVSINDMPAARVGDMLTCSAKIYKGSQNVIIGGSPATTDKISPEIPEWLNYAILGVGLAAACVIVGPVVATFGLVGSLAGGYGGTWLGGEIFGEGSDGQKLMGLAGAVLGGAVGGGIGKGVMEEPPALPEEPPAVPEEPQPATSPHIDPNDVSGKTPSEIDAFAKQKGLIPKGPDPMNGKGAYVDPVTGEQRVLSHPNAESPHAHVNNPAGERLGPDGSVVEPESPEAHLPIGKD